MDNEIFVETEWLADHINDQGLCIVDVRFTRCFSSHDKVAEECLEDYLEGHIPGAFYVDCIKDLTDPSFKDIFYVAPPEKLRRVMSSVGVNNQTKIVCYDEAPYPLASARLWWTLLYYGHTDVKILEGGIRRWINEGRPLSKKVPTLTRGYFTPNIHEDLRATKKKVKNSLENEETVIIDCLSIPQHIGKTLNSWSIRKGHIPGAICLPPMELIDGLDRSSPKQERDEAMGNDKAYPFFSKDRLMDIFTQAGIKQDTSVITYCGKGEAACTVFLALKMAGIDNASVYEGSLAEWSRDLNLPMSVSE
ncbi:MAG: sulfurtransferase [Deltaproteobacteria bacterium]|nr:sulfurtransferase [Deltaproteobacteria bacterium]